MSENLIYGADIISYGAANDGSTDCSGALSKAIQNGENLISFPFGTYLFTKPLSLNSNTKLHFHPNANIIFAPGNKNEKTFIFAENAVSIEICGGLFNIKDGVKCNVFSFDNCQNIRIVGCSINAPTGNGSILLNTCEYATITDVIFNGMSDALVLLGDCKNLNFKNCTVKSAANVIQCAKQNKPCNISDLSVRNISVLFCDSFIEFLSGNANDIELENIDARFSFAFLKLFEDFSLSDILIENTKVYIINRTTGTDKNPAYFIFASTPDGFEMRNFKRLSDLESSPLVPTLLFRNTNTDNAKFIVDGISLDNVINTRGKSKTVSMTTAKLTNPCNKFIYTLEISVAKDDTLNIPFGDFDYISIYAN